MVTAYLFLTIYHSRIVVTAYLILIGAGEFSCWLMLIYTHPTPPSVKCPNLAFPKTDRCKGGKAQTRSNNLPGRCRKTAAGQQAAPGRRSWLKL